MTIPASARGRLHAACRHGCDCDQSELYLNLSFKATLASAGTGTLTHLAIELLKSLAKIDVAHLPFKGGGGGIIGVIGGEISGIVTPVTLVQGHHKAGRIRIVVVTTAARRSLATEFPIFVAVGVRNT